MSCFTNSPWNGDVGLVDSLPMGPKFSCDNIYLIVLPSYNLAIIFKKKRKVHIGGKKKLLSLLTWCEERT